MFEDLVEYLLLLEVFDDLELLATLLLEDRRLLTASFVDLLLLLDVRATAADLEGPTPLLSVLLDRVS